MTTTQQQRDAWRASAEIVKGLGSAVPWVNELVTGMLALLDERDALAVELAAARTDAAAIGRSLDAYARGREFGEYVVDELVAIRDAVDVLAKGGA